MKRDEWLDILESDLSGQMSEAQFWAKHNGDPTFKAQARRIAECKRQQLEALRDLRYLYATSQPLPESPKEGE